MAGTGSQPPGRRVSWRDVGVYAMAVIPFIGLRLATNGTLGFHIDELYYIASGRHPAFGYVDFPPIVPLTARFETDLAGVSPRTLRLLPALLGSVDVVLCGAYVRKFGGSLRLQALGLLVGTSGPAILGTWLFQTVIFDQVTWMVALYLFLSLVMEPKPRTWILLGLTLGIGLEIKLTIAALIAGVAIAVLVTPRLRRDLRTRHPWGGVIIMLLIWLPNVVWQAVNGFPTVTYVLNHGGGAGSGAGPLAFVAYFLLLLTLLIPLWVAGFIRLFRSLEFRAMGIACAVPLAIFLFAGRFYYPAPTIPIVMAAGLIALAHIERRRLRSQLTACVVIASLLGAAALSKITIPTTPESALHSTGLDTQQTDMAATVGWVSITDQITAIYQALPPQDRVATVIVSSDYGVTGALEVYGRHQRLPASFSPQLSAFYWLPKHLAATDVLMVGYEPATVGFMCTAPTVVARITIPYHVVNLEQGAPVTRCHLRAPLPDVWGRLKNFS